MKWYALLRYLFRGDRFSASSVQVFSALIYCEEVSTSEIPLLETSLLRDMVQVSSALVHYKIFLTAEIAVLITSLLHDMVQVFSTLIHCKMISTTEIHVLRTSFLRVIDANTINSRLSKHALFH